ncbi:MAG: hypothetical protein AB1689_27140 [Thermodesulfobacteriota bacterium]
MAHVAVDPERVPRRDELAPASTFRQRLHVGLDAAAFAGNRSTRRALALRENA